MSFDPSGLSVYIDGEYVDGSEARVSFWDHGVLYGDGIFEGMRLCLATATDPIVAALSEGYRARTRDPRYLVPVAGLAS